MRIALPYLVVSLALSPCASWATDALAPPSLLQHPSQQQDHQQRLAKGLCILDQILEDVANGIDVRGLSEGENATMTPDLAYTLGIALARELRERIPLEKAGRKPRVLLTGDHRWSTPALCQAAEDALRRFGVDVVRCAEPVSTPAANIVARLREPGMKEDPFDALVQITASHNPWTRPKAQNGFKVNLKDTAGYLRGLYGAELAAMLQRAMADDVRNLPPETAWGRSTATQILDKYIAHMRTLWDQRLKGIGVTLEDMKHVVMVVDSGNGVMGPIVKRTLDALGIPYAGVHDEVLTAVDSNPEHRADPNQEEHYRVHLPEEVRRVATDPAHAGKIVIGIALDGDGDRVGITDEAGEHCRYLTFAQQAYVFRLAERERPGIVPELLDIRSSEECMEIRVKQSYLGAPGWPRIRKRMREVGAWSASESSRHEFDTPFPEDLNADRIDDGLWAALKAAGEAAKYRRKAIPFGSGPTSLCEVLNRPWYPMLPELRPAVRGATRAERYKLIPAITQKLRTALREKFGAKNIDELRVPEEPDAVRFRMHDEISEFLGWLLVRAGNSENALSISAQGRDEACLRSVVALMQATLQGFPQVDQDSLRKSVDAVHAADFVIGGFNSTETIRRLTGLNGIPLVKLEEIMRPGRSSDYGFLGREESLLEILARDNDCVLGAGFTHQQLANLLFRVMKGEEFELNGRHFSSAPHIEQTAGKQESPFRDGFSASSNYIVTCRETGAFMKFSALLPHLIHRYGFYEGRGTAYRISPDDIIRFFYPDRAAALPKESPLKTMSAPDMQAIDLALSNGMRFTAGLSPEGIPTLRVHSDHGDWSYPHIVEFSGNKDMIAFVHLNPVDMQPRYFGGDAFSKKLEEISRLDYEGSKALVHSNVLERLLGDLAGANYVDNIILDHFPAHKLPDVGAGQPLPIESSL